MLNKLKLKAKLIAIFLAIGILPVFVISFITLNSASSALEELSYNKLTAVKEIKKAEIEKYFNYIQGQIKTFSKDIMIVNAMKEFKTAFNNIESELNLSANKISIYKQNVRNYYQNDFLPTLNENSGESKNINQYIPTENKTIILQNFYFADNPNPVGEKDNLDYAHDGSWYSEVHQKYHPVIRHFLKEFGYYDIFLVDPETGYIIYSVFKEVDYTTSLLSGPYKNTNFATAFNNARNAIDDDYVSLEDFKPYDPSYSAPASFIASPIFDGSKKIGVLVFQMPVDVINEIMTSKGRWEEVGLGLSGETYLVADDFTLRNNSRFLVEDKEAYLDALKNGGISKTALNRIDALETSIFLQECRTSSASKALAGNTGNQIINDYRGVPVLSSYAPVNVSGLKWAILAEIDEEEAFAASNNMTQFAIFLSVIIAALIAFAGYLFAGKIANPVVRLSEAAQKVANGDTNISVKVNSKDEIGRLGIAFNSMVTSIAESIEKIEQKSEEAEKTAIQAERTATEAHAAQEYLARNTQVLLTEMEKFAQGDLTVKVKAENENDDIGRLFHGFNTTVDKIKNTISQLAEAVEATASASTQISSNTEEMAAGSQQQSSQTAEVAAAMEEMSRTIVETASNATNAAEASKESSEQANAGANKLKKSKEGMERIVVASETTGNKISSLASKTDQIGEIAQVIDDIADQTNLLALNAAIEAARAGEQGRGFAVVADEVRKLAERTTKATKEIAVTIKAIQSEAKEANISMEEAGNAIKDGMLLNDEVGTALSAILTSAKNVATQINQVAAASEEQSATAEQVSSNIEAINNVANESAIGVQQIATASEGLNKLTENLSQLVEQFKLDRNEHSYSVGDNGSIIHK